MRRIIGGVGRALVTIGILILLFVAYQLWGTGLYEAREQDKLQAQFAKELAKEKADGPAGGHRAPRPPPCPQVPPPVGDAVGIIQIPKIGLERAVVQGIGVPDLRKGPGHYPATPMPGQLGNAAIAGHRTTYGAPFNRLDELAAGDPIDRQHARRHLPLLGDPAARRVAEGRLRPGPDAERHAHAHHLQPEVLRVDSGSWSRPCSTRTRSPKPQKPAPHPVASRASLDDALSGRGRAQAADACGGACSPRAVGAAVVADLPPLPPLDDLVPRRDPVRGRALRLLLPPRTPAPRELLSASSASRRRRG